MSRSHPLVRLLLAAVAAGTTLQLAACGRPAPAAQGGVLVEVGSSRLDGATLERWLLTLHTAPDRATAAKLVSNWINLALLVDADGHGKTLEDSALVDAVIAPDAARGATLEYFRARNAKQPPATDGQVDSLADVDSVRVFQQILLRAGPTVDSIALDQRARGLLKRLQGGADFPALVQEASQDTFSRSNNGYLPAISRAQLELVPPQVKAIWLLKPRELSGLVTEGGGVHIYRRATRIESHAALRDWLTPVLARRSDSLFVDSIATARHLAIAADARPRLRALAAEPVIARDGAPMATWDGGALAPAMVRTAVLMSIPEVRARLTTAPDSELTAMLTTLARQRITLSVVTSEPMPSVEARKALAPAYRSMLDGMRAELAHVSRRGTPGETAAEFTDSVLAGRQKNVALPGALADVLRSRAKITVDSAAVASVLLKAIPAWSAAHGNAATSAARTP